MNKKTFRSEPDQYTPFEIELHKEETHSLIKILKEKNCKSLIIIRTNSDDHTSLNLPSKTFNQLNVAGCQKFTIAAEFVSTTTAGFIELDVYTGTWEEMILMEAELSFSASPFYISCQQDKVEFTIGEKGESTMEIKTDSDRGFSICTTLMHGAVKASTLQHHVAENAPGAEVIRRLYGRIRGRVNGIGFYDRQEDNKRSYSENFQATLLEGFHPITESAE